MRRSIIRLDSLPAKWAGGLLGVGLACAACADLAKTRDVRVTVVDENSRPLPGAVFYVEAVDDRGAFAFQWARAGLAGEVPQSAREPLKLPWRRGARLAMAAFAPGRRPAVLRETAGSIDSDGAVLELDPGRAWNPDLARLAYPFEAVPDLAARLREPAAAPLVEAFRSAWAARSESTGAPIPSPAAPPNG
jgi:hypothetical protein